MASQQDLLEQLRSLSKPQLALIAFLSWLVYWLVVFTYRIWFSPISHIPGPKLAAATFWYEFYYELWPHKFQYLWKIRELHEQYGPIVRINPIHVHIHDHDYYDTIYAGGHRKRNRCSWYMHSGAKSMNGIVEIIDHNEHKLRRRAVEPFFSKKSVQALEGQIVEKVEKLVSRFTSALAESKEAGEKAAIINLSDAMSALTLDVISDYCFGEPMGALEMETYGHDFITILHEGVQMRPVGRQFPLLVNTIFDLPMWLAMKMNKKLTEIVGFFDGLTKMVEEAKDEVAGKRVAKGGGRRTVFHELLEKDLPPQELETNVLRGNAANFLGAGTETTARNLAVTVYYLLQNPGILANLRRELKTLLPKRDSKASLPDLEKLPYLSAVVNEGLRCAHGVSARQPRIATDEDLQYKQYKIPRGTPLMESLYLLNTDPAVFPEPLKFRPERWIENPKLSKYQVAFSKGSMSCLGINLATSELYLTIAYVMRWMEMEIYDTIEERDVLTINDCFIGMTDLKSEGIKVKVLNELSS